MTNDELAHLLADLGDDGDTVELPDGRTLRLRIEPDQDQRMPDGDWFGAIEFVKSPRRDSIAADYGYPHSARPAGFDGAAEILRCNNCDPVWWQPPEDARKDRHLRDSMRSTLVNVLEYGYCGLVLELCDGRDAYGRPIVVNMASLWGIEPFPDAGYVAEVVADLAAELDLLAT